MVAGLETIYPGIYPNAITANSVASHEMVCTWCNWYFHAFCILFLFSTYTSGPLYLFLDMTIDISIKNSDQTTSKLQRNAPYCLFSHFLLKHLILRDQYGKKTVTTMKKKTEINLHFAC